MRRPRRGYSVETSRGDAAAATRIFRGDESRRCRGGDVEIWSRPADASGITTRLSRRSCRSAASTPASGRSRSARPGGELNFMVPNKLRCPERPVEINSRPARPRGGSRAGARRPRGSSAARARRSRRSSATSRTPRSSRTFFSRRTTTATPSASTTRTTWRTRSSRAGTASPAPTRPGSPTGKKQTSSSGSRARRTRRSGRARASSGGRRTRRTPGTRFCR